MTDSASCLAGDVWPFLDDVGTDLLRTYFERTDTPSGHRFSGGAFDRFGDNPPDRFVADDLIAVSFLGVQVPGHAALAILEHQAEELNRLLTAVPDGVDLWDASEDLVAPGSAASELWSSLRALDNMGPVTTGKLLARKRPRLLPVYDSVVRAALQPGSRSFWLPLRAELQDQRIVERLRSMRQAAGLDQSISELRILDVAVWMRNRLASNRPLPFTDCPKAR